MKQIIKKSFLLYAEASVEYEGRAKSKLCQGNYLIIHKPDGTFLIMGSQKATPLNYQRPGSEIYIEKGKITSTRKKEKITIHLKKIHHIYMIDNWSNNKIEITMTENDLREHIIKNINKLVKDEIQETIKEYKTPYGPVDLVAIGKDIHHIIEVKRKKSNISACTQLLRYMGYFKEQDKTAIGWLMSPLISDNAKAYCQNSQLRWVQVDHQEYNPSQESSQEPSSQGQPSS